MTLERHRSALIPEVEFSPGGEIRFNKGEGTFPLTHGKRTHGGLPDFSRDANDNFPAPSERTYASYDPKRDENKRKYKKNRESSEYEKVMHNINSTLSSRALSSLQRKVRRVASRDTESLNLDDAPKFGTLNLAKTMSERRSMRRPPSSSSGGGSTIRNYPGSLDRQKVKRRFSFSLKRKVSVDPDAHTYVNGHMPQILETVEVRNKKIAEETLPSIIFLVSGSVMLILGIVKLVLCWWHEAYCPVWTALFMITLGILGRLHGGDYMSKSINFAYIAIGGLTTTAVIICCAVLLKVAAPMVVEVASGITSEMVTQRITFTNLGKGLAEIAVDTMVVLNVSLDFVVLVLCLINFYALTATIIAISNHWDASYVVTGDCDHRGNPRLFNPLEQAMLGMATTVVGLLVVSFSQYDKNTYYTPAIAGITVIIAGLSSFCYGKRPDIIWLGIVAMVMEFLALALCGLATVFVTLALVQDIDNVKVSEVPSSMALIPQEVALKAYHGRSGAALAFSGLFYVAMIINVIFASGIMFRVGRKACCTCGFDDPMMGATRF